MQKPLILLTNDDGIHSRGLWAAASALDALGEVLVVAPEEEQSSTGRSFPATSIGRIHPVAAKVDNKVFEGYAVHGSPAQTVQHALMRVVTRQVDLVVSGINYGANVGSGVTISGTVGAALEGASFGIPGLAVSLDTTYEEHLNKSPDVDFSIAAHFTALFARILLRTELPDDVHVLKVEVPVNATPQTEWQMARQSQRRLYEPDVPENVSLGDALRFDYTVQDGKQMEPGSDARVVAEGKVAVTPLSLDMTSRVPLDELLILLDGHEGSSD